MTAVDPLIDTLFRSTAPAAAGAAAITSAPPVREAGTRSRAGNAMKRTRRALMAGAARAVEVSGTRITMAQVAAAGGVAKATLYNHFRTREAVLAALVLTEVESLVESTAELALPEALQTAALAISRHPVPHALAHVEPAALAALGRVDPASAGWQAARRGVEEALARAGTRGVELVLRWLSSFVLTPGSAASIAEDVQLLLQALPPDQGSGSSAAVPLTAG